MTWPAGTTAASRTGQRGSSVILGHVDSFTGTSVFFSIKTLRLVTCGGPFDPRPASTWTTSWSTPT